MQCDCGWLRHGKHSLIRKSVHLMEQSAIEDDLLRETAVDNLTYKPQFFTNLWVTLDTVSALPANNTTISDHAVSNAKR
jgi:hypothetical protein